MPLVPADRRAPRKPQIYELLRRWYGDPPILFRHERAVLERAYGQWLAKGRVTAEMAAELLLFTVESLTFRIERLGQDPSTERQQMIQVLMRRRAHPGLRADDKKLLADLELIERVSAERQPDQQEPPGSDHHRVAAAYKRVRKNHVATIARLLSQIEGRVESKETIRIHGRRKAGVIHLGEKRRLETQLQGLLAELGETFLDPQTTMRQRAASVRKWKQFALREPT